MATAFNDFDQYAQRAFEGQIEDRSMADVVSEQLIDGPTPIGRAVAEVDHRIAHLVRTGETPFGITVREITRDNNAENDVEFPDETAGSVIIHGRVRVKTVGGAANGEPVYVIPATGQLTNVATDNIEFPGATWRTTADADELALVQLTGGQ